MCLLEREWHADQIGWCYHCIGIPLSSRNLCANTSGAKGKEVTTGDGQPKPPIQTQISAEPGCPLQALHYATFEDAHFLSDRARLVDLHGCCLRLSLSPLYDDHRGVREQLSFLPRFCRSDVLGHWRGLVIWCLYIWCSQRPYCKGQVEEWGDESRISLATNDSGFLSRPGWS